MCSNSCIPCLKQSHFWLAVTSIHITYFHNFWHHHHTTALWPFFRDYPVSRCQKRNFWTLWCKGRLTEADTLNIRLGATPSGLTSAHLHHPPYFFMGRMPSLPPNQQCQSTEGNQRICIMEKTLEFSSTVLPAPSPYQTCRKKYVVAK